MAKTKGRPKVALACSECKHRNYWTTKNRMKKEKLQLRKYCPYCGKHTLHKEAK